MQGKEASLCLEIDRSIQFESVLLALKWVNSISCYIRSPLYLLDGLDASRILDSSVHQGSRKRIKCQGEEISSESGMEQTAKIEITIAPSLLNHYIRKSEQTKFRHAT